MNSNSLSNQSGAALFVSLIMLLILTIVGLSAAQRGNLQEKVAANVHLENMAFSAAESATGSFLIEAAVGNPNTPGHALFEARTTGTLANAYYDSNGQRVATGYLDNDHGSDVYSTISVTEVGACAPVRCSGFSFKLTSSDVGVGCREYRIDSTGNVGKIGNPVRSVTTSTWAYEVTACQ